MNSSNFYSFHNLLPTFSRGKTKCIKQLSVLQSEAPTFEGRDVVSLPGLRITCKLKCVNEDSTNRFHIDLYIILAYSNSDIY